MVAAHVRVQLLARAEPTSEPSLIFASLVPQRHARQRNANESNEPIRTEEREEEMTLRAIPFNPAPRGDFVIPFKRQRERERTERLKGRAPT